MALVNNRCDFCPICVCECAVLLECRQHRVAKIVIKINRGDVRGTGRGDTQFRGPRRLPGEDDLVDTFLFSVVLDQSE